MHRASVAIIIKILYNILIFNFLVFKLLYYYVEGSEKPLAGQTTVMETATASEPACASGDQHGVKEPVPHAGCLPL
jgi:hypothetical protein